VAPLLEGWRGMLRGRTVMPLAAAERKQMDSRAALHWVARQEEAARPRTETLQEPDHKMKMDLRASPPPLGAPSARTGMAALGLPAARQRKRDWPGKANALAASRRAQRAMALMAAGFLMAAQS
jgi:hypothetical protein